MTNYHYLIIGGGMTAAAAVDGIREVDPTGSIGMISTEPDAPYDRPPLSKALWKGKPLDTIWRKTEDKRVGMHLGRVVKQIVPERKTCRGRQGRRFHLRKAFVSHGRQASAPSVSATTRSFTFARCRITGVFAHSPKPDAGLQSSVAALSVRRSLRPWP